MTGVELITRERARQIVEEGFTAAHDAAHAPSDLVRAGLCYVLHYEIINIATRYSFMIPQLWPWNPTWWKPRGGAVRVLIKAGALLLAAADRIAAEIDRIKVEGEISHD